MLNKQYPTPPKYPLTVFETKGTHNCCLKSMEVYTPKYLFTYFKKFKQKLKLFGQPVLSAFWKLNTGEQIFPIYLLHWKKLRYLDSLRYVCTRQRRLTQKYIFLLNIYLCGVVELQQEIFINLTKNKTAYFPCMSIIENRNIEFSLSINTVSY